MRVEIGKYEINPANKIFVHAWFLKNKVDPSKAVAILAAASGVPCVVIAYWLGELTGYPQELKTSVDILVQFYGYTEITGKPEGCPW